MSTGDYGDDDFLPEEMLAGEDLDESLQGPDVDWLDVLDDSIVDFIIDVVAGNYE